MPNIPLVQLDIGAIATGDDYKQSLQLLLAELSRLEMRITALENGEDDQPFDFDQVHFEFPWHLMSFGYKLVGNKFKVFAGAVYQEGKTRLAFSADTLTLTGATEYVYVQCGRLIFSGGIMNVITHASTRPATTDTNYQFPLYKLTSADGGANYTLDAIYNMGDIHLDTPMV